MKCVRCSALLNPLSSPAEVSSHDISLDKQEVLVKTSLSYDEIHAKIAKTGKQILSGAKVEA